MTVRVFISSRINELKEERLRVADTLSLQMGLVPLLFEKEPAGGHLPDWWREKISESDIYVCLLGKEISRAVVDELLTAKRLARPVAVLTNQGNLLVKRRLKVVKDNSWTSRDREIKELYDFITEQKWKEFKTSEDLEREVRAAISRYLRVDTLVPLEMVVERERIEEVSAVFVAPKEYEDARQKLLETNLVVMGGPPHIGKTATAVSLLNEVLDSGKIITVVQLHNLDDLVRVRRVKKIGILLDDVFGAVQYDTDSFADSWEEVKRMAEANIVVATSRTEVVQETAYESKLVYRSLERSIVNLSEASYSIKTRSAIARRHVHYWASKGISLRGKDIILNRAEYIAKKLHFPHNIAHLVKFYGDEISTVKDLEDCVEKSRVIEDEIGKWFTRLEEGIRLFLIVLAVYEESTEEQLSKLYDRICEEMKAGSLPIGDIKKEVGSYMSLGRRCRLRHPSYRVAILEQAYVTYGEELLRCVRSISAAVYAVGIGSKVKEAIAILGIRHPNEIMRVLGEMRTVDKSVDNDIVGIIRRIGWKYPYETLMVVLDWQSLSGVEKLVGALHTRLLHMPITEVDKWEPLLNKMVIHPNRVVRYRSAQLVQRFASIKPRKALEITETLTKDEDKRVRRSAAMTIQPLAAKLPQEALKLLRQLTSDPDQSVRERARKRIDEVEKRLTEGLGN
jgi:hypothetical protein